MKMSSLITDNLFGVKGYVAVVTGGSSGIGFMIARVSLKHLCLPKLWFVRSFWFGPLILCHNRDL